MSVLCYIVALSRLPIADVIAIMQTAPLVPDLGARFPSPGAGRGGARAPRHTRLRRRRSGRPARSRRNLVRRPACLRLGGADRGARSDRSRRAGAHSGHGRDLRDQRHGDGGCRRDVGRVRELARRRRAGISLFLASPVCSSPWGTSGSCWPIGSAERLLSRPSSTASRFGACSRAFSCSALCQTPSRSPGIALIAGSGVAIVLIDRRRGRHEQIALTEAL